MNLRGLLDFVLCKTFFRVKFEGRENVDSSKRYVFVANHVSAIDAIRHFVGKARESHRR